TSSVTTSALASTAEAAAVIYADTGEIIFSKNADKRLSMASTTKIMSALLLCEYGNLEREIKVTSEMVTVEGSSMGLLPDDIVTLRGLLYGMMLPSGNDAANTTAYVVGGSVEEFVELMNQKAVELGLSNTHFVTPSGLDADEHYTTAYELALIAAAALKNDDFLAAASSESAVLYYGNPPYRRTLTNHNKLLGDYEGLIGVKTGFTKKSGRCLVTAAERDGKRIIAVTLHDSNDWQNHKELLDYGFSQIKTQEVPLKNKTITLSVIGGEKGSVIAEIPDVFVNTVGDKELKVKVLSEKFLYAPVEEGQTVARLCVYADGLLLKKINIKTEESVAAKKVGRLEKFKNIFLRILSA
ncbi:MAG: D-alanyl-D-alanine carboxypeptidase, partial [Clostridia bacterium]|nr:D-alanyl-D-alanine carboxypeptidase [Clostridia bacterium]